MKAPLPHDEKERLEALRRYKILDTRSERSFDDITLLASHVCGTPISLVSLVDETRQWIKSEIGPMAIEVPREISFCSHAILQTDVLVVQDAQADERFSSNPLVTGDPGIRFYAGAPLRTRDGHALGALCVIDQVPRELSAEQKLALEALSRQVTTLLESRRVLMELWQTVGELKKTEEQLTSRTAFFEAKVNSSKDGVLVVDSQGTKILQNRQFNEMWKIPKKIVEEKNYEKQLEWMAGLVNEPERYKDKVRHLYSHPDKSSQDQIELRDGRVFDRYTSQVVGKEGHSYGRIWTFHDITDRKREEDQLKLSEQRLTQANQALQAVLDAATHFAIIAGTPEGRLTIFNRGAERMLGYTSEEIVGKLTPDVFHLESEMIVRGRELTEELGRPVQGIDVFVEKARQGTPEEREWTYVRKDSSQLTVSLVITASYAANGAIVGFLGVAKDVTAQKKAEEMRKRAEDDLKTSVLRLSLAAKAMQAGIWDLDIQTNVMVWDERMCETYGLPKNLPVDYQTWAKTVILEDLPATEATLQALIASKSQDSADFRIKLPDGSQRHIHAAAGVVLDDAGEVVRVIGVNIDVTERKKLEQQFLRSQRLESIGTLAGGIAHDLNNILAPIVMSIDLLKGTSENPEATSILETIEISAKRGSEIVGQVLSFARGMEGDRIEVQLKHLLKELEKIINNTFPKDIRLRSTIPNQTWSIMGDPTQVRQILLNLCVNARDAMPNGGLLTVRAENCLIDEQYATMYPQARPGRYVQLNVTDTGTGIPPGILGKIFEPFFTTKESAKGTGLGLSTVMAIVKSHEGFINVYSEPGKGTSFKVYLPAMETPSEALIRTSRKVSLPRGNGETVLVVDDEASILAITSRTLQAFGCQVLTATDGADAVAVYLEHQNKIALVLTDMAMPVMDGPALIHALLRINPAVKIIAASGLDTNGTVTEATRASVKHFLNKPYTAETLLTAVQAVLTESN